MRSETTPHSWIDRHGATHWEKTAAVPDHEGAVPRVSTPQRISLDSLNPIISECGRADCRDYTWVVESPDAHAVLLWANGMFNHENPASSEFEHLPGSDLWTLTLRLPSSWRASYRIAVWKNRETPPWRLGGDRFAVRNGAFLASTIDPRAGETIGGSHGPSSLACGPDAPHEIWRGGTARPGAAGVIHEHSFMETGRYGEQQMWLYEPPSTGKMGCDTPLLILFDGQVWHRELGLPRLLDTMILAGTLPPLYVAMVDSRDMAARWDELGVPTGQVDFVLDELLDFLHEHYGVGSTKDTTIVSGQSLGGIAAVWALALGGYRIGHAIAQSPSLWRFDTAPTLRDQHDWLSLHLQAGRFEGDMLTHARELHRELTETPTSAPKTRTVTIEAVDGGHDWAWWRVSLLDRLAAILGDDQL